MRRLATISSARITSGLGARAGRGVATGRGGCAVIAVLWPLTLGGGAAGVAVLSMGGFLFLVKLQRLDERFEIGFFAADQVGGTGHLDEPGVLLERHNGAED